MGTYTNVQYIDDNDVTYQMRVDTRRFAWDAGTPSTAIAYAAALIGSAQIDERNLKVRHVRAADSAGKVYVIPIPDVTSPAWSAGGDLVDFPVGGPDNDMVADLTIFAKIGERSRHAVVPYAA